MQIRLDDACARWGLTGPTEIATTPRATVYRVRHSAGVAALKLLTEDGVKSEGRAPALLRHWAGDGAVELLAATPDAHLLGWLPGPSVGDLARGGEDDKATHLIATTAKRLHSARPMTGIETLEQILAPLLSHPTPTVDMRHATSLARTLLATAPAPVLLHGDLHHDNLLADGTGGWAAIDPKGVLGDPAYEYGNAFRNPVGMEPEARDPARIQRLAAIFATESGLPPARLLGWAAVLPALSIIWNKVETQPEAEDHRILAALLPLAHAAQPA